MHIPRKEVSSLNTPTAPSTQTAIIKDSTNHAPNNPRVAKYSPKTEDSHRQTSTKELTYEIPTSAAPIIAVRSLLTDRDVVLISPIKLSKDKEVKLPILTR